MEFRFRSSINNPGASHKPLFLYAHLNLRICPHIAHPLAGGKLGDDVVKSVPAGEPDLDFSRQPAAPPRGGQVQVSRINVARHSLRLRLLNQWQVSTKFISWPSENCNQQAN